MFLTKKGDDILYRHPSRNNIANFLLYERIFHMAIPAKEVSYLHSFLTRQLQRQYFDKPVGRSNLVNASGAASP